MKHFLLFSILISSLLGFGSVAAEPPLYSEAIEGLDPMDLSDVDPKVAGIPVSYTHLTLPTTSRV